MAKIYDAYGNEVVINEKSFALTQADVKIHDAKFETKTTTFLKDAFKRFCKNKSSIAGAIIIGILVLLSIIVPFASPHDVKTEDNEVAKLRPRLFETGFWSGEETKMGITYDRENQVPVGFSNKGVIEILDHRTEIIRTTSQYANGGVFVVKTKTNNVNPYFYSYALFNMNKDGGYLLSLSMEDFGDGYIEKFNRGTYRILLTYNNTTNYKNGDANAFDYIVLQDWTTELKEYDFDLSAILEANNLDAIENCRIRFELKKEADQLTYMAIGDLTISCSETEGEKVTHGVVESDVLTQKELLSAISLSDANAVLAMSANKKTGLFDNEYWKCNGQPNVDNLEIEVVDFVYNKYYVVFGDTEKTLGKSQVQQYIDLGYLKYDFEVGVSSFEILDFERCPIVEVYNQKTKEVAGKDPETGEDVVTTLIYVDCLVCQYKEKGYTSMPKYLFGTDASGFDLFTKCFTNLLRSLILAVITSAICFVFGLVWGAISGYFGGSVDLMMERFMEILGGVPWVVVMTLVLLILKDVPIIVRLGVAICLTGWMGTAGVTRTQFYRFKRREYILASRTLGANDMRLIFRHILPNSMGTIITSSVLKIPSVIFTESSLAYLGLLKGTNSFGTILSGNQQYISTYPMLILFPALIISLLMISFNLFGNGLRDAFNPSLKGSD